MGIFSSGVASQFGFKPETTYGVQITPDRFIDVLDPSAPELEQEWADGEGMYAQGAYLRATRSVQTTRMAKATLEGCAVGRNWGTLFRQMLGSTATAPVLIAGSAYRQTHQYASQDGLSLTAQWGVPEVAAGVVQPFTMVGVKVAGFELKCAKGDFLTASMDLIGSDVLTLATTPASNALAAATYATPQEGFTWNQAVVKIGGTASTASGRVSVAGGTVVAAVINGFTLKHDQDMNTDGYSTSSTFSREPKSKRPKTMLTLDNEFRLRTEFYDVFRAGTTVPVQITFTGSIISGSDRYSVDIIASACKIRTANPELNGDDLASQSIELMVLSDGTNSALQIELVSADSAL